MAIQKSLPLPISRVLALAEREIGVQEEPRGSNRGERIDQFLASCGLPPGYAWCAAFIAFIGLLAAELGIPGFDHWPLPASASCDLVLYKARKIGILQNTPRVGDLFLVMASANDAIHVGFVTGVNKDGTISTIEGNSNPGGSREGYAVVARPIRKVHNLKFVRWIDALPDPEKPWKVFLRSRTGTKKLICGEAFLQEGNNYIPVRDYIQALGLPDATLRWNDETQGLDYLGAPMAVQILFKGDGKAWGNLRQLAAWSGFSIEIDAKTRTNTLFLAK
ncbi:MAG: CHAP domain-containing protein [Armatimonadota bacterium]